jgi:ubiquinone/menaquinone biosynthesis C-methylase UbiE
MDKKQAKYLLNKTREDYNKIATGFARTRGFVWPELDFLIKYTTQGDKVLDLGCGNGRYFEAFKDKDVDYTGVDNSEKLIKIAKQSYPKGNFKTANALNLPFQDSHFDKIYSFAVLHHIPSKQLRLQFLKEAKRVLKPKGVLTLTVWKFNRKKQFKLILKFYILKLLQKNKLEFRDVIIPWASTTQRYVHLFSKRELKNSLKQSNFKIKQTGTVFRKSKKTGNIYTIAIK